MLCRNAGSPQQALSRYALELAECVGLLSRMCFVSQAGMQNEAAGEQVRVYVLPKWMIGSRGMLKCQEPGRIRSVELFGGDWTREAQAGLG